MTQLSSIHQGQPVLMRGSFDTARAGMIMVHGRGATAQDILSLADILDDPSFIYLAPQAAGNTWYPNRFTMPIATNEPYLSSALQVLDDMIAQMAANGIPSERVMLLGFSQGACLVLEYVARHARRYGGVAGLSGGLIGPEGTPRDYDGSLAGTPIFLGCSDVDTHIPKQRVIETDEVLTYLDAEVQTILYPGMGHTITEDELGHVNRIMNGILAVKP